MAIRSRIMLALTLVAGLVGAAGVLLAPRPSPALSCDDYITWFRTAQLETLRVNGREVPIPDRVPEIQIRVTSYDPDSPVIGRDTKVRPTNCHWTFEPFKAEPGSEVQR